MLMARSKTRLPKGKNPNTKAAGSKPIWKGSLNFGLVNIPVSLHSLEAADLLDFDLLDRRDFSPVRYRRVNEKTGREVPWDEIVKGYEYEKGQYVALSDQDFRSANVDATQSIEIIEFVDADQISPIYYDKPYYLEPPKNARRSYVLLREVMARKGKVGIAKIVVRTRQHLAAVIPQGPYLIVNLMRFSHELRDNIRSHRSELDPKHIEISNQEIKMGERLVETMIGEWNPEKYRDDYREDLLKLIKRKTRTGATKEVSAAEAPRPKRQGKVVDIMHLLKRSVEQAEKKEEPARRRKAS
jgi:DNA end-binding protein Ku